MATDYAGEAGSNHGLTSWDELWGYTSEKAVRLWEEMTPVPTRRNSIRFISTYAGFENESQLLWQLYLQAVGTDEHPSGQGERVHPTLPIYANRAARVIAYWDHAPRMPWQTEAYLSAQRRTLRRNTYLRLHENRWTTAESPFITSELWDACVRPDLTPQLASTGRVYVGLDAAPKHDRSAGVVVQLVGSRVRLVTHRIWKATPEEPLDIEETIEAWLLELQQRHSIGRVYADPYQLHRTITSLSRNGYPIEEFPQTEANLTLMGQNLFDLIKGRNLEVYAAADDLRTHALNAVAIEKTRGWKLAKEKTGKKIDGVVALAMACVATVDHGFKGPAVATIQADTTWQRRRWDQPEPADLAAALGAGANLGSMLHRIRQRS